MKRTWSLILTLTLLLILFSGPTAFAFTDIDKDPGQKSIKALESLGLVNGTGGGRFEPDSSLTYAQAVRLAVKGFDFSLDRFSFIQEPLASDYYTSVPNDAWYARDFLAAFLNGLPLPKDIHPDAAISREQYAELLYRTMLTKGDYAVHNSYILIGDGEDVEDGYMTAVQNLLIAKIVKLDQDFRFRPKEEISRSDGADWLYQALLFCEGP